MKNINKKFKNTELKSVSSKNLKLKLTADLPSPNDKIARKKVAKLRIVTKSYDTE